MYKKQSVSSFSFVQAELPMPRKYVLLQCEIFHYVLAGIQNKKTTLWICYDNILSKRHNSVINIDNGVLQNTNVPDYMAYSTNIIDIEAKYTDIVKVSCKIMSMHSVAIDIRFNIGLGFNKFL